MPKKQPKNAFFFYMLHYKEQERRKGHFFPGGLTEVSAAASESWKGMTDQQKGPFEKQAKEAKVGPRKELEKFTSQGIPLSVIENEQKQVENEYRTMTRTIKQLVQEAFNNNTIGSLELIFIAGTYFVNVKETYLPAELALVTMTFENGIVKKFHTYVDPETIPMGYQYQAKENSLQTHRLPIPPKAKGEKNYERILDEMHKFMGSPNRILFTTKENIPIIKSFIQSFIDYRGNDDGLDASKYQVYPLHQIFFDIKEEAVKNSVDGCSFKSIHIAEEHLKREDYAYLTGTACAFHEELDCAKHCALAHVQNWAYIFADHICMDLNIAPVTGKHFPPEIDVSHVADMTRTDFSSSQLNDTNNDTISFVDKPERPHHSRHFASSSSAMAAAVPNVVTSQWELAQAGSSVSSNRDDDFPSLGSHNRRAIPKKRPEQRNVNNPWNTSSSSSSSSNGSNPWNNQRRDAQFRNNGTDGSLRESDLDSSISRGMGRGSMLYRHESGFGRGRSHNERPTGSNHSGYSHHDRNSKRHHPSDYYSNDRSKKRRYKQHEP